MGKNRNYIYKRRMKKQVKLNDSKETQLWRTEACAVL